MRLQLQSEADKTTAVVVSTMMEAWEIVRSGLVQNGTVDDASVILRHCLLSHASLDPLRTSGST